MRHARKRLTELLGEIRRRRVYRVGTVYLASFFVLVQSANLLLPAGMLPDWAYRFLILIGVIGFPVALVLTWLYDITPDGIRRTTGGPVLSPLALSGMLSVGVLVTIGVGVAAWKLSKPGPADTAATTTFSPADPNPTRLAVLYFDDHSPGGELSYLAEGLTEDLIHDLANSPALSVVSRHGVKPFRAGTTSPDSLRRALGVGTFVEGSVTRSGDLVRVTGQLIDANTGMHLASHMVERPMSDLFALQDELIEQISTSIRRTLGIEVRSRARAHETESVEAWSYFQRAGEIADRTHAIWLEDAAAGARNLARADSLLLRAAELDPSWLQPMLARAWNGVDRSRFSSEIPGSYSGPELEAMLPLADSIIERAGPESPDALELRGTVRFRLAGADETEWGHLAPSAESDLRTAIDQDPHRARARWTLAQLLRDRGEVTEARQLAEEAFARDAFLEETPRIIQMLFHTAFEQEDHVEAQEWCDRGRRRFPENRDFVICALLHHASAEGAPPDIERARALADTLAAISPPSDRELFRAYGDMQLAKTFARAGLPDSARVAIDRAHGEGFQSWLGYDEAHARLLLGETERALELLESYLEMRPGRRAYWPRDWWLRPLWDHPDFIAMISDDR